MIQLQFLKKGGFSPVCIKSWELFVLSLSQTAAHKIDGLARFLEVCVNFMSSFV